ncbi:MAG: hypothetical protein HOP30_02910 [Cyclobacteriaceae bacterium]|nr:hypothetical protein [Cyclobacteriaceae bacterium]
MKNLRTILASLLALFVLTSSISHSVSFHFCGGEIESVAIFGKAQPCAMHDRACDHNGNTNHSSIHHKGCCEDATFKIDSDKYLSKIAEKITVENAQFIFARSTDVVQEFTPGVGLTSSPFLNYKPPLIERDITILVHTFLI